LAASGLLTEHILSYGYLRLGWFCFTIYTIDAILHVTFAYVQVNVAQFHPFAGRGIVYGTKRGKVRTFSKS
jgi:hypothetical protein